MDSSIEDLSAAVTSGQRINETSKNKDSTTKLSGYKLIKQIEDSRFNSTKNNSLRK